MKGYHDIGGEQAGRVERFEESWLYWQKLSEALRNVLGDARRNLVSVDEVRRMFETFGVEKYNLGFYERRTEAMASLLVEKSVLSWPEIETHMAEIADRAKATET